ncbi:PP2C family protein-serine/threonine phosphatase [Brevibacillus daliensis]|uniref:PP2C family protein-serine/threonine phosphatase n=1 Tax=Brevibacillus daliensis TaxID=2892995 RepID=UPI001E4F4DFC|nr:PP2C family protein-serine/threonine phosphatase [Brevibacillus daliensis]
MTGKWIRQTDQSPLQSHVTQLSSHVLNYEAETPPMNSTQSTIGEEDFFAMDDIHMRNLESYPPLLGPMQYSFQVMLSNYRQLLQKYEEVLCDYKAIQVDIYKAVQLQQDMLPVIPSYENIDIGVKQAPLKKLCGDYYFFSEIDEDRFSISIADIMGSGITAALYSPMLHYAIRGEELICPTEMLSRINKQAEIKLPSCVFITMLHGIYDRKLHTFSYANAGHEPGYIYRYKEKEMYELSGRGAAIGVLKNSTYSLCSVTLEKGDAIVLVTDGVVERRELAQQVIEQKIRKYLSENDNISMQELVEKIHYYYTEEKDQPINDDYTIMIIRRNYN